MNQVDNAGAVGRGDGDGADNAAVFGLQGVQGLEVIAVLFLALGDAEHDRQTCVFQVLPGALCAHGHALASVLGGAENDARFHCAQGAENVACKVKEAGAVQNVDLAAGKVYRGQRSGDGNLAGDLFGIAVADGVAVADLAQTVDGAGDVQHALGKAGFAGVAVAQQGNVTDVFGFVAHVLLPLCQSICEKKTSFSSNNNQFIIH